MPPTLPARSARHLRRACPDGRRAPLVVAVLVVVGLVAGPPAARAWEPATEGSGPVASGTQGAQPSAGGGSAAPAQAGGGQAHHETLDEADPAGTAPAAGPDDRSAEPGERGAPGTAAGAPGGDTAEAADHPGGAEASADTAGGDPAEAAADVHAPAALDADADGIVDGLDVDADGDGLADHDPEPPASATLVDADADGVPDAEDPDQPSLAGAGSGPLLGRRTGPSLPDQVGALPPAGHGATQPAGSGGTPATVQVGAPPSASSGASPSGPAGGQPPAGSSGWPVGGTPLADVRAQPRQGGAGAGTAPGDGAASGQEPAAEPAAEVAPLSLAGVLTDQLGVDPTVAMVGTTVASIALNFTPIGYAKGVADAVLGYDLLTGRQLALWERAVNLVPGAVAIGALGKAIKAVDAAVEIAKVAKATEAVVETAEAVTGAVKALDAAEEVAEAAGDVAAGVVAAAHGADEAGDAVRATGGLLDDTADAVEAADLPIPYGDGTGRLQLKAARTGGEWPAQVPDGFRPDGTIPAIGPPAVRKVIPYTMCNLGGTCGPIAATMVMVDPLRKAVRLGDVIEEAAKLSPGVRTGDGIKMLPLANAMNNLGVKARWYRWRTLDDLVQLAPDLDAAIPGGNPVIVAITTLDEQGVRTAHGVVVDGIGTRLGQQVVRIRNPNGVVYDQLLSEFAKQFKGEVITVTTR